MDSTGSQDSGRGPSRRSGKKPMQFMFIDSTSHGVNAKPDKAVRSFVMKSARSKKPWSTRQKSPKTEADSGADSPPDEKPPITPSLETKSAHISPASSDYLTTPTTPIFSPLSAQSYASADTSFFTFPHAHPYHHPPASSPRVVCNISNCTGDICGEPHDSYTALTSRAHFTLRSANTFDCFPIPTNERIRGLIDNCE